MVFVSDGARSRLRQFDSNSVTRYAATGAALRRLARFLILVPSSVIRPSALRMPNTCVNRSLSAACLSERKPDSVRMTNGLQPAQPLAARLILALPGQFTRRIDPAAVGVQPQTDQQLWLGIFASGAAFYRSDLHDKSANPVAQPAPKWRAHCARLLATSPRPRCATAVVGDQSLPVEEQRVRR